MNVRAGPGERRRNVPRRDPRAGASVLIGTGRASPPLAIKRGDWAGL